MLGFQVTAPGVVMVAEGVAILVLLVALRRAWHRSAAERFAAAVAALEEALGEVPAVRPRVAGNVVRLADRRSRRVPARRAKADDDGARRDPEARGTGPAGRRELPVSGWVERR